MVGITFFLHGMSRRALGRAVVDSTRVLAGAGFVLVFTVPMVRVYINSGVNAAGLASMPVAMAEWVASSVGPVWPLFAGVTGALGAFIAGSNSRLPDCTEDPSTLDSETVGRLGSSAIQQCWDTEWLLDAFDAEGRFLGPVEAPMLPSEFGVFGTYPRPLSLFIDGDTVVASEEGPDGVLRVKRYRLVLPGER